MRAWQLNDSATAISFADIPQPNPDPGEVLIRVHAVGVISTELTWQPTTHTKTGGKRSRAIPGHEFSGTIAAIGPNTTGVTVGQEIYGMNDWYTDGGTADCCITRPEQIAPRPGRLTHPQAASVPISALTAWQGLFDHAKLQKGGRVLIHGGGGGVGVFAVQFAANHGAHVATTASARDKQLLLQLGAEQVIDYHTARFEEAVKQVDVVFDTVGGESLQRSWKILSPTGRLITIVSDPASLQDERAKKAFFIVEPNRTQLSAIGDQLENKSIQTVIAAVVPFAKADSAYIAKANPKIGPGKVVVTVIE
jgi:NADPH:quinone reductase-like Zn-dependent oxidoreductase